MHLQVSALTWDMKKTKKCFTLPCQNMLDISLVIQHGLSLFFIKVTAGKANVW